jgi:hypothetical protein
MMGAWVRDGLPARLNLSNCEMVAQLFGDPVHPNVLGKVLLADWLLAHLAAAERDLAAALAEAALQALRRAPGDLEGGSSGGEGEPAEVAIDYAIKRG